MADTLFMIDLDRTLLDVSEVMSLAENVSKSLKIDFDTIKQASAAAEGTGWSYSPLEAIHQADGAKFEAFKDLFVKNADKSKLLYEDGQRFLRKLEETGQQYMILTYAMDEGWQELKLKATGLDDVPHYITKNAIKTEDINSWIDENGSIAPPLGGITPSKSAWLIDDRGRVFSNLPSSCKGFYLRRHDSADIKPDKLPEGVEQIGSFDELFDRI